MIGGHGGEGKRSCGSGWFVELSIRIWESWVNEENEEKGAAVK